MKRENSSFLIIVLCLASGFELRIVHSKSSSNPCAYKKCESNEVACLEVVPKFATGLCKCARYCKKVKPDKYEIFEDRLTAFIDAFGENEEIPTVNENSSELVQVKQGGAACSPLSCFNGGICYTTQNEIAKRNCAIPARAGSECLLLEKNQAICSCQSGFSGERCQFSFDSFNMCSNVNLCNNGGKCISITDSKFQCICPPSYAGVYCETISFKPCEDQNNYIAEGAPLCHPVNGICSNEGKCLCKFGFTGLSCEIDSLKIPNDSRSSSSQEASVSYSQPIFSSSKYSSTSVSNNTGKKNSKVSSLSKRYHLTTKWKEAKSQANAKISMESSRGINISLPKIAPALLKKASRPYKVKV